jgi:hypothetical protein
MVVDYACAALQLLQDERSRASYVMFVTCCSCCSSSAAQFLEKAAAVCLAIRGVTIATNLISPTMT